MSFYSKRKKIFRLLLRLPIPYKARLYLLRRMGVIIGNNTGIGGGFYLSDKSTDYGLVIIGNNVDIAANLTITTTSGPKFSRLMKIYPIVTGKVIIEDDVWIGNNVTILPGVTIGKFSIIGAGCVISKDVPPFSVVTTGMNICKQYPKALLKRLESQS